MPDFNKTSERRHRILDAIVNELEAQAQIDSARLSPYVDAENPEYALIDGTWNLAAVVKAIDYALFAGADGVIVDPELPCKPKEPK